MNDNPPPVETDLEALRQLTGAPEMDEPVLSEQAFAGQEIRSSRPTWKMPIPKLMLIGGAMVPVFGLAAYFLLNSQQTHRANTTPDSARTDAPATTSDTAVEELQRAREEIAALKSRMALNDQSYIQTQQRSPSTPRNQPASTPIRTTPQSPVATRPATVATHSSPPAVNYRPPVPQIRTVSTPSRIAGGDRLSQPQADPVEQWQQLARLGSYGAIAPPENLPVGNSFARASAPTSRNSLATDRGTLTASTGAIPTAQVAPTSVVPDLYNRAAVPLPSENSSTSSQTEVIAPTIPGSEAEVSLAVGNEAIASHDEPIPPSGEVLQNEDNQIAANPPILEEAEAAILGGQPPMQAVIAGASASGHLETPVILDKTANGDRFVVVLAEPLKDNRGRIAIPAESKLLVKVDGISGDGLVDLSAVQVVWDQNTGQRELVLPEGVILVRGEDGEPLTAQHWEDRGGAIAGMDLGQFALGAIRRSAELYTRSNTRVATSNGSTVITEENPAPNILAGALEGGTEAILDTISERNQRAVEELERRPNIAYIEAGRPVQIFVNQSMQMPM